jgi:ABC-type antimicrobial peptide transport system permease subunit
VIGVSRDYKPGSMDDTSPIGPNFVVSYRYLPTRNTGIVIRGQDEPSQLTTAVRKTIRGSDPTMPVFDVMTLEEVRRLGFWSQRLYGWMFSMYGVIALILASVGVYGVIAYSVSQRTQEIGVRVALGAQPSDVIRLVVRGGAVLALAGIAIGLVGAFGVTRLIQSLLIDVSSTDLLSFVGVTLFLAAVALLASYVPARRATRVDPLTALRSE